MQGIGICAAQRRTADPSGRGVNMLPLFTAPNCRNNARKSDTRRHFWAGIRQPDPAVKRARSKRGDMSRLRASVA